MTFLILFYLFRASVKTEFPFLGQLPSRVLRLLSAGYRILK
ncbi:hypothetical protein EVA_21578 [gut metagenome]|uniref:Uncharacterized protein n=1 Tax=gut metagenome TaxID=749906 RepID=J9BRW2_9ZZZZ